MIPLTFKAKHSLSFLMIQRVSQFLFFHYSQYNKFESIPYYLSDLEYVFI